MSRFQDKVALVTGAASGMGRATALRLASEGARVLLGDLNAEGNEATAAEIIAAGGDARAVTYNAMDEASSVALVDAAVSAFGRLDVVVNAAGIAGFYRVDELTQDIFQRFLTINTTSVFSICRAAVPHLRETRGAIVNFSSLNSRTMTAYQSAYCASKAALTALSKCLALELEADGVRVNVVSPGGIETPLVKSVRFPQSINFKLLANLQPLSRKGQPEEVAALVAFLASSEASYISGEDVIIDGGLRSAL